MRNPGSRRGKRSTLPSAVEQWSAKPKLGPGPVTDNHHGLPPNTLNSNPNPLAKTSPAPSPDTLSPMRHGYRDHRQILFRSSSTKVSSYISCTGCAPDGLLIRLIGPNSSVYLQDAVVCLIHKMIADIWPQHTSNQHVKCGTDLSDNVTISKAEHHHLVRSSPPSSRQSQVPQCQLHDPLLSSHLLTVCIRIDPSITGISYVLFTRPCARLHIRPSDD